MINIFGTTIEAPPINPGQFLDGILSDVAKKESERSVLKDFVSPRLPEIISDAQKEAATMELETHRQKAFDFYLSQLKSIGAYEQLVLKTIASDKNFASTKTADLLIRGGKPVLPSTFPGDHKKAEAMVNGTLRSSIGDEECRQYLIRRQIQTHVQSIAKDMFFAINTGLSPAESIRFCSVIYELHKIKTADIQNSKAFRDTLARVIGTGEPLSLVHIKCLRYVYPRSGGVKIITDTDDTVVDGVLGKYAPKSELKLFDRLDHVARILEQNGVTVDNQIIVSDEDIDLLFPDNHQFVPMEYKVQAKIDAQKYLDFLRQKYGDRFNFSTVNQLIPSVKPEYDQLRQQVKSDLLHQGGHYMPDSFFEHDRVDHQQSYYQDLFGPSYDRSEARRSVSEQIASVIALQLIIRTLGKNIIIVEENREGENRLIAGGQYPVFFTTLRDPAVFSYQTQKINYRTRSQKELR